MDRAPVAVRGVDEDRSRGQGFHDLPHGEHGAQGPQSSTRDAMIGPSPGNDFEAFFVSPEMVIMLGQFDRCFYRFRSVTEKGEPVDFSGSDFRQDLGKPDSRHICKLHRGKIREFADLIIDRLSNLFSSVAHMNGTGHAGNKIKVTLAVLIVDPDPFPSGDHSDAFFEFALLGFSVR